MLVVNNSSHCLLLYTSQSSFASEHPSRLVSWVVVLLVVLLVAVVVVVVIRLVFYSTAMQVSERHNAVWRS